MRSEANQARRLAAIMFIDMVGFSALTHRNEALALEILVGLQGIVETLLPVHGGQIIKTLGDGFLAEFDSALGAVEYGVELQTRLRADNQQAPAERRVQVRIGIHLGDVEHSRGDVFGNGVNIAARVQPLAAPGEICLTQPVFEQVRGRIACRIDSLGAKALKNIPEPMVVYRITPGGGGSGLGGLGFGPGMKTACKWVAAGLLVAVAGLALWHYRPARDRESQLVVLPFEMLSRDLEGESIVAGLQETLSTKLMQMRQFSPRLNVVPPAMVRQAQATNTELARKQFRADLVLHGTLKREPNEVRLDIYLWDTRRSRSITNATLTYVPSDLHLMQDQVAQVAAGWVGVALPPDAREVLAQGQTRDPTAFLAYLNGMGKLARHDRLDGLDAAIADFESAVKHDPAYARALAALAEACWRKYEATHEERWVAQATNNALQALSLAPRVTPALITLGMIYRGTGRDRDAIQVLTQALALSPNDSEVYKELGMAYEQQHRQGEAEQTLKQSIALRPSWFGHNVLGSFYYRVGRWLEAEKAFRKALEFTPDNSLVLLNLGGICWLLGREEEAIQALNRALETNPQPDAYSQVGTILFFQARYPEAIRNFDKALALDKLNPVFWSNLGDALRVSRQDPARISVSYRRGVELAERQLAVSPQDNTLRAVLANCLAGLQQLDRAVAEVKRARAAEPGNSQITFLSALVHELAGQREAALAELTLALSNSYPRIEVTRHPDLENLRQDPRFPPLLRSPAP